MCKASLNKLKITSPTFYAQRILSYQEWQNQNELALLKTRKDASEHHSAEVFVQSHMQGLILELVAQGWLELEAFIIIAFPSYRKDKTSTYEQMYG